MKTTESSTRFQNNQCLSLIACIGLVALFGCASGDPAETDPQSTSGKDSEETIVVEDKPVIPDDPTEEPVVAPSVQSGSQAIAPLVDIEEGMAYADARTRLIQQGWVPVKGSEQPPSGVERTLYNVGFTEVAACAGTGLGQCRFDFYHPDRSEDNSLAVTTYGGGKPEVAAWSTQSRKAAGGSTKDSTKPQSTIPVSFHGKWDMSLEGCSIQGSDGRLVIEANRIQFYESSGPVTEVYVQGDSQITVTGEMSSEGMTEVDTRVFQLSGDRSTLTDVGDYNVVRYRCPAN
ncbi:MAG: hypothetical protein HC799_07730 [Limnothrix sp. RL_2_0]|nr:hypothetical protein [Limnothrix sp. RL_2_0]